MKIQSNPYSNIRYFYGTPGDLSTSAGEEAQELLDKTGRWSERLYDMNEDEIQDYELIAHNILQVLIKNNYIAFENAPWEDGFVRHSVKSVYNEGINEFCLWGDYYYIELLMKLYSYYNLKKYMN